MSRFFRFIMGAVLLAPMPLSAENYSYADFEASVPHIDLETCPEGLAEGDVFCRVSMNNDALHVYVFESGGMQEFVALHSFYEDEFSLRFGQ
ncbi:MAG: hypothetical protein JJU15_17320 [Pararhodobacter sp.]|nr:hypothetical protein [Pararhodobacter sp.]